jgi:WD40 repeat protein
VWSVAFSTDGKRLAAADSMGRVTVWSVSPVPVGPGPNVGVWTRAPFNGGIGAVGIAPDGNEVFAVNGDGAVKVLAAGTGKELRSLPKIGNMGSAVFLPDGKHLITSHAKDIKVRDLKSGKVVRTMPLSILPDEQFPQLALSPDGKRLLSWATYGPLKEWDIATGKVTVVLLRHPQKGRVQSAEYTDKGKAALVVQDTAPSLLAVPSGKALPLPKGANKGTFRMLLSKDGKYVVKGLYDGPAELVDAATGKKKHSLPTYTANIDTLGKPTVEAPPSLAAFSPDSKALLLAGWVKDQRNPDMPACVLWDIEKGKVREKLVFAREAPIRPPLPPK